MTAAAVAAGAGARTILLDEQPALGGHLRWRTLTVPGVNLTLRGLPGVQVVERLSEGLLAAGVDIETSTSVWGLLDHQTLNIVGPEAPGQLRARTIILATGSTDIVEPFPNATLPGVLTARAALIFLNIHRVFPGRRFAVVGNGQIAEDVATELELAGAEVVCRPAAVAGLRVTGRYGVERVDAGDASYEVDSVVLALGHQPDAALAAQAGASFGYSAACGYAPLRTRLLETSIPQLYVIGEAAGVTSAAEAMAEGRLVGLRAVGASEAELDHAYSRLEALRTPERCRTVADLLLSDTDS
jgi:sarcosine oxidase subunit alpha